jgi:AcrR family transcriptional regulator
MDDFKTNFVDGESRIFESLFPKRLSKGDKKKLDMVEKAIEVFGQKGVDATTYDDLAIELNTSRSHISYHFKEKDQLILAAIRYMMTEGLDFTIHKMRQSLSAKQRLISYVDGYYGFFLEYPKYIPILIYFYYASSIHEVYRELQSEIKKGALARIQELLEQIYKENGKRLPKDIKLITQWVHGLLIGSTVVTLMTSKKENKEEFLETRNNILKGIVRLTKVKLLN